MSAEQSPPQLPALVAPEIPAHQIAVDNLGINAVKAHESAFAAEMVADNAEQREAWARDIQEIKPFRKLNTEDYELAFSPALMSLS